MTTFLLIVLGSFVWLGLGAFGSAMAARYFWDQFGNVLGRPKEDQGFFSIMCIAGPINILAVVLQFGYQKPLWDWGPRPPRNPRSYEYWVERNREG